MNQDPTPQEIENMSEAESQAFIEQRVALLIQEIEERIEEFVSLTNETGKQVKKNWRKLKKSRKA